ncbi:hypothetical protein POX_e06359 [Penicillium oxalicum]|uniref:hypothetical protein n=1 Tax=Penicillium oxalicum TaxID=69781 RepID=UPI0020B83570|nr:hypothetical protein POX_e06359 [Penicillium oxalicum]KAI2788345.1 hypothetical protein POX_e06359 [Penicillium oxalicum]
MPNHAMPTHPLQSQSPFLKSSVLKMLIMAEDPQCRDRPFSLVPGTLSASDDDVIPTSLPFWGSSEELT